MAYSRTRAKTAKQCELCCQYIEVGELYHKETFLPWFGDNQGFTHVACCEWCWRREEALVEGDNGTYSYCLNEEFRTEIAERFSELCSDMFGFTIWLRGGGNNYDTNRLDQSEIYHYRKYGWYGLWTTQELVEGCEAKLVRRKFIPMPERS